MTDPHARCVAEVARLRAIAAAAANTHEQISLSWPRTAGKDALIHFWRDWSPATALRVCDWAEDVLSRHEPWTDSVGRGVCLQCNRACHSRSGIMCDDPDGPWPCDEVRAVARALDIAVEPEGPIAEPPSYAGADAEEYRSISAEDVRYALPAAVWKTLDVWFGCRDTDAAAPSEQPEETLP